MGLLFSTLLLSCLVSMNYARSQLVFKVALLCVNSVSYYQSIVVIHNYCYIILFYTQVSHYHKTMMTSSPHFVNPLFSKYQSGSEFYTSSYDLPSCAKVTKGSAYVPHSSASFSGGGAMNSATHHQQTSPGSGFAAPSTSAFPTPNMNYDHPPGSTCSPSGYATGHITGQNGSNNVASTANAVAAAYYWPNSAAGDLGDAHPGFGGMAGADVLNNNYSMDASQNPHHNYPWLSMPGKYQSLMFHTQTLSVKV